MIHKSFLTNSSAWHFIKNEISSVNENSQDKKTIIWNNGLSEQDLVDILHSGTFKKIFEFLISGYYFG